jgi:hypothetical protein
MGNLVSLPYTERPEQRAQCALNLWTNESCAQRPFQRHVTAMDDPNGTENQHNHSKIGDSTARVN